MPCVERDRAVWSGCAALAIAAAAVLAGCGSPTPPQIAAEPQGERGVREAGPRSPDQGIVSAPPLPPGVGNVAPPAATIVLPSPDRMTSWADVRMQAARRLIAAHPNGTYLGRPPPILLAIPVIEVELHADGSIRNIVVLRHPGQARDTTQLAIDALHRAAPFGNVSRLPRPWKFVETFLFDNDRRFKPRSLD